MSLRDDDLEAQQEADIILAHPDLHVTTDDGVPLLVRVAVFGGYNAKYPKGERVRWWISEPSGTNHVGPALPAHLYLRDDPEFTARVIREWWKTRAPSAGQP